MMSEDEDFAAQSEGDFQDSEESDGLLLDDEGDDDMYENVERQDRNYKCLKPQDIVDMMDTQIKKFADLFELPPATARQLLTYMNWNADLLTEQYFAGEDALYKKSGIANPRKQKPPHELSPTANYECTICFDTVPGKETNQITCGHHFCKECWREFLYVTIDEGRVSVICCPARDCPRQLDESAILQMLSDGNHPKKETMLAKYSRLIANAFVVDSKNLRWCPGKDCNNAVQIQVLRDPEVVCDCGTKFCFGCGGPPHAPATCKMVSEWTSKSNKDEANAKWIAAYTKECPNCQFVIHKDGGCQYMSCSKCSHRFCWICLGAFDHKDHACNKLQTEAGLDPNSARAQLNKYTHFLNRYNAHQQSIQLEEKLRLIADKLMQELADKGASWIDVQFIKQATDALMETRGILKHTYIYGYYLPERTNREIFEFLQADLESGVERLSGLLEAVGEKNRVAIINATDYVRQRQKNLLEGLADGDISIMGKANTEVVYTNDENAKYDGWIYTVAR